MKSYQFAAGVSLTAICLVLAACGSKVDSTPDPTPTPTPTPTATPTPTGTPTPASTPTPTEPYFTVDEIMAKGGDKLFTAGGVKWQTLSPAAGQESFLPGGVLIFEYLESANNYRISRPAPAVSPTPSPAPSPIQVTYPAGSGVTTGQVTRFTTTTGSVTDTLDLIVPQQGGVDLSYTRFLTFTHDDTGTANDLNYRTVYGFLTQTGNMPISGTASYFTTVAGNATRGSTNYDLSGTSTGTFTVNFTGTGGTLSTSLDLKGKETSVSPITDFGIVSGTGTILGAGFDGTLTGAGTTGKFGGAFFGPFAAEYGYGWYFNGTDFTADGYASGKKSP